jgi:deazaflavin-dependent oxidoreductase (nitroreductase family)
VATLGPLFMVQAVAALVGAVVVVVTRWVVVALGCNLPMLGTVVGFLGADTVGIFGFALPAVTGWAYEALLCELLSSLLLAIVVARAGRTAGGTSGRGLGGRAAGRRPSDATVAQRPPVLRTGTPRERPGGRVTGAGEGGTGLTMADANQADRRNQANQANHREHRPVVDAGFRLMNATHRAVLTLTGGRYPKTLFGMPAVELHTTGRKTGKRRSTMLASPQHDENRVVLVASKGGDDRDPQWYRNLCANPDVEITIEGTTKKMRARTASAEEKAALWPEILKVYKWYENYQKRADRDIPVVICERRAGV